MAEYIDTSMLIVDGTLIHYHGKDMLLNLQTDSRTDSLSGIGAGAFMLCHSLRRVVLPSSVKTIGKDAFLGCKNLTEVQMHNAVAVEKGAFGNIPELKKITITDIELSSDAYWNLIQSGRRTGENRVLLAQIPAWNTVGDVLAASRDITYKTDTALPMSVGTLFRFKEVDPHFESVARKMDCFSFDGSLSEQTEEQALKRMVKKPATECYDRVSDAAYDAALRNEQMQWHKKTVLAVLDDDVTQCQNERYKVQLTLHYDRFFWQSLRRLVYNGQVYGVYSRRYLSPEPRLNYTQQDMTIYYVDPINKTLHPLTDRAEVLEVYAKYKLLSIL